MKPITCPPQPFSLQAFEALAYTGRNRLKWRLRRSIPAGVIIRVARIKGAAPFDGAFAALGGRPRMVEE